MKYRIEAVFETEDEESANDLYGELANAISYEMEVKVYETESKDVTKLYENAWRNGA